MKRAVKLFFLILSIILVYSCSNNKKADNELKAIASSQNAHCPVKITDDTQLDSVYALPRKQLVYCYSLTLLSPLSFNRDGFENERKPYIVSGIKSSDDMAYLRTLGVTFLYKYYDTKGNLLSQIAVEPKEYR